MGPGTTVFAVFVVVLGLLFQFYVQPKLRYIGVGRPIRAINNDNCEKIPELKACEASWYHQPSGLLYLACAGSRDARWAWLPNPDHYNTKARSDDEYLAILDTKASGPASSRIKKVTPQNFAGTNGRGSYNLHGFGVYVANDGLGGESTDDAIRIFLINHRPQASAEVVGANSTVELFESRLGSDSMTHLKTFADPEILFEPNDLVPTGPDSFLFSNDFSVKNSKIKKLVQAFVPSSWIGYCDAKGCKKAYEKRAYPNGLAGAKQYPSPKHNIVYSASSADEHVDVYELQSDGTLVLQDRIHVGYAMDNLLMDNSGAVYAAIFPRPLSIGDVFDHPGSDKSMPGGAVRITKNKSKDAYFGHKYNVDHIFEDDGGVVDSVTAVVGDPERNLLFLTGVLSEHVTICKLAPGVLA